MGGFGDWLKILLLPPGSLLLMVAAGWLLAALGWRRLGRAMAAAAIVLLAALSLPYVGTTLLRALETGPPLSAPSADAAQAIIVLSGDYRLSSPEYGRSELGALSLERVRYGARLHRQTGLPLLVAGGKPRAADRSLAEMIRDVLAEDYAIPARWLEDRSTDTHENAVFSAAILRAEGVSRVYLVTHGWHMARALQSFASTGLVAIPAPMGLRAPPRAELDGFLPAARALADSAFAIHEGIGRIWYAVVYP